MELIQFSVFEYFQLIHVADDVWEWLGKTEKQIKSSDPVSVDPDVLRQQRDRKVC